MVYTSVNNVESTEMIAQIFTITKWSLLSFYKSSNSLIVHDFEYYFFMKKFSEAWGTMYIGWDFCLFVLILYRLYKYHLRRTIKVIALEGQYSLHWTNHIRNSSINVLHTFLLWLLILLPALLIEYIPFALYHAYFLYRSNTC